MVVASVNLEAVVAEAVVVVGDGIIMVEDPVRIIVRTVWMLNENMMCMDKDCAI